MLAKFATAQQQQQRLHKGHGAAPRAGTAAGGSGAEQVRSVKGVQGYADAPFDPTKGLAAIYDACETALLKAAGASPSPAASAPTHQHARSAEQTQQRSATAAKLLSVVNKTAGSSSRSPLANVGAGGGAGAAASPTHGHRQGIGSDRLSRDAVTEQMQAMNAHVRAAHNYLADGDEGDSAAPQDVATAVALAINQPPPATAHDEEKAPRCPRRKGPGRTRNVTNNGFATSSCGARGRHTDEWRGTATQATMTTCIPLRFRPRRWPPPRTRKILPSKQARAPRALEARLRHH
jgi:hypothetical protein